MNTAGFRTPCTGDQGFVLIPLGSGKGARDSIVLVLKIKASYFTGKKNGFIQE